MAATISNGSRSNIGRSNTDLNENEGQIMTDEEYFEEKQRLEEKEAEEKFGGLHGGFIMDGSLYIECDHCGKDQSWCSCCQCWTRNCCVPYGTCGCS